MKVILGIETSCDETAAAVLKEENGRIQILSNVVASSALLQAKYGGIIPEQAAREQIKSIIPVIEETLRFASLAQGSSVELDAIAVTYGPGLIGSLLVGVETAKTLSVIWGKPLIPVNHLIGHFYSNWITPSVIPAKAGIHTKNNLWIPDQVGDDKKEFPNFPCIGLLVSGGHTDLVLFKDHSEYEYLGGTRDDAAGECFDKCARLLGLPYPGGPEISKLAQKGNPKAFDLPRPMINSKDFDFSFSGLKTAVANLVKTQPVILRPKAEESLTNVSLKRVKRSFANAQDDNLANLSASIEAAIVDVLVKKTVRATQKYNIDQIMIAGGVAANQKLVSQLQLAINNEQLSIKLHVPPPNLCTDNGAMIAARAFFEKPINPPTNGPLSLQANPNLSL